MWKIKPKTREILVRYMQAWGMQAHAPITSAKILASLQDVSTYDLIVVDLHLTQLNSLDLMRSLHQKSKGPSVVLLASLNDSGIRDRAGEFGVKSVLYKPVKEQKLLAAVQETLHGLLVQPRQTQTEANSTVARRVGRRRSSCGFCWQKTMW